MLTNFAAEQYGHTLSGFKSGVLCYSSLAGSYAWVVQSSDHLIRQDSPNLLVVAELHVEILLFPGLALLVAMSFVRKESHLFSSDHA